jgi:hypothetical protein
MTSTASPLQNIPAKTRKRMEAITHEVTGGDMRMRPVEGGVRRRPHQCFPMPLPGLPETDRKPLRNRGVLRSRTGGNIWREPRIYPFVRQGIRRRLPLLSALRIHRFLGTDAQTRFFGGRGRLLRRPLVLSSEASCLYRPPAPLAEHCDIEQPSPRRLISRESRSPTFLRPARDGQPGPVRFERQSTDLVAGRAEAICIILPRER